MKRDKWTKVFLLLLLGISFSACNRSEEPDKLVSAVKKYRVPGGPLENVIASRETDLQKKFPGKPIERKWTHEKIGEGQYKIFASIGFAGDSAPQESFIWTLIRDNDKSIPGKESHWVLEPQNREAHKVNRISE